MDFPLHYQPDAAPGSLIQPGILPTRLQQPHIPYDFSSISASDYEAQYQVAQVTYQQFHVQQPPGISTGHFSEVQQGAHSNGDGQGYVAYRSTFASVPSIPVATPASASSPMGPPTQSRKRKAPTLRETDWVPYKALILDLHTTQGLPLLQVKQTIEAEFGFKAELRQYRSRIHQWRGDKNVKTHEMQAIVRKRQKRTLVETGKGQLSFDVRGNIVEPKKIERWMKRNNVVESTLYAPSPAASTPSEVGCYTVSNRGSPAMMSAHSPAGVSVMTQSPQMPSPTLSTVSSVFQLQNSTFPGQSPALAHKPLAQPHNTFSNASTSTSSQMEIDMSSRSRYQGDEEERLRDQILQAELSSDGRAEERSRILYELLGGVLLNQGRLRAAEEVARRLLWSYEGQSETNEDDDEGKLRALDLLGWVLQHQGLGEKASKLHRRVLQGRERLLGFEHPDTLTSIQKLGSALERQGKYEEAEAMGRRALDGRERVLGRNHYDTLMIFSQLGTVLDQQEKYGEAEAMVRRALEGSEKILRRGDPRTLIIVCRLASVLENQGKYEEAEVMQRRNLSGIEKVLGPEHPHTLSSFQLLGRMLHRQDKYKEAEALHQRVLEVSEKVLGIEHRDTLTSVHHLAVALQRQQRYSDSLKLYQRAYEGRVKVLGAQHPDTVLCLEDYKSAMQEARECAADTARAQGDGQE